MKKTIGYEIKTLDNLLERRMIIFSKQNKLNNLISQTQIKILIFLGRNINEHIYQKDVERVFRLRRSTASGVIKTMEKNNLIYRLPNPDDARLKELKLQDSTMTKLNDMKNKIEILENELLEGISEEELNVFLSVIDKMKSNVKEEI